MRRVLGNRLFRKNILLAGIAGAVLSLVLCIQAYTAPKKPKNDKPALRAFMRTKLEASQQILEGLCTENFGLIGTGADSLKKIGSAEEWRISNDATYSQRSAEFIRVAERLKKAADEKKTDGVALTWIEATMSCIECHRWVRAELIAKGKQNADSSELARLEAIDGRLVEYLSGAK